MTASLHFAHDSVGLPCFKILCSGILNVPLPYGMHLKVITKGRHIFKRLCPQQHRCAMDVTRDSQGWSLSIPFLHCSGPGAKSSPLMVLLSLRKVVLLWYCLCMWLPCRKRDVGANTSTRRVSWENRYLWTKKELVEDQLKSCPCTWLVGSNFFVFLHWANWRKKTWRRILLSTPRWRLVQLIPLLELK
jgi:hypothetical protein